MDLINEQSIQAEEKQPPTFSNLELLLECKMFCESNPSHHKGVLRNKLNAIQGRIEELIEREKTQRGINES